MKFAVAAFVIFTLSLNTISIAAVKDPKPIPRDYDLSPLNLLTMTEFAPMPKLGRIVAIDPNDQADDSDAPDPADAEKKIVDSLTTWLQSAAREGEPKISVEELGDGPQHLRVSATPPQHERIAKLIAGRIARRELQVAVTTRVVRIGKETEAALALELQKKLVASKDAKGAITLDEDQSAELAQAGAHDHDALDLTAPRITIYSGQRAFAALTTDNHFIADYQRGDDKSWQKKLKQFQTGLVIDVLGQVEEKEQVSIDLNVQIATLKEMQRKPFGDPADKLSVETPVIETRECKEAISIESGGTSLLAVPDAAKDSPPIYLLVNAVIGERKVTAEMR